MKQYKRLKLVRKVGPIIIVIPMVITKNIFVILLLALIWILIEFKYIAPKLPQRTKRQEGEVFVVEPIKNTFFFGKIIRTPISVNDPTMDGGHLVYIYKQTFNPLDVPEYMDPNNLIISPQIIDNKGWEQGFFQTVGVQKITNEELELNYGFWDIVTKKFVNEEGKELSRTPETFDDYGLMSYGTIIDQLRKKLNAS